MFATSNKFNQMATMNDLVAGFRVCLHRQPEPAAIKHFKPQIAKGMTLNRLTQILTESQEFKKLCTADVITVEMLDGYTVCLDSKDTDFTPGIIAGTQIRAACHQGDSRELFKPGQDVFVDTGANVGCLSFLAATIAGPTGQVHAFEPNPANVQRLYGGILLNKFENVRVYPHAVSDRRTTFVVAGGTSNGDVSSAGGADVVEVRRCVHSVGRSR